MFTSQQFHVDSFIPRPQNLTHHQPLDHKARCYDHQAVNLYISELLPGASAQWGHQMSFFPNVKLVISLGVTCIILFGWIKKVGLAFLQVSEKGHQNGVIQPLQLARFACFNVMNGLVWSNHFQDLAGQQHPQLENSKENQNLINLNKILETRPTCRRIYSNFTRRMLPGEHLDVDMVKWCEVCRSKTPV